MKVALLADRLPIENGTGIARYSQEIYNGLRERGFDVEVISLGPMPLPFDEALTHAIRLPTRALREANRFDLLHATQPITALAFPWIKQTKIVTYHDLISLLSKNSGNSLHARLASPFFFAIGKWSDSIITNSSQTRDELLAHMRFPEEKLKTISLGVGAEFQPFERPLRQWFTIGYLGRLGRRKRVDYLIGTLRRIKERHPDVRVKLVIYGKKIGEYRNLVNLAERLSLTADVQFKGSLAEGKLVEAYNSFDVFLLPSEWEGFGLPILEAQKCGTPVLIRESARIPIEVSKCAIKATSEEDAADKIHELLTNADFRKETIKAGMRYSNQFSWEKAVNETIKVYEEASQR